MENILTIRDLTVTVAIDRGVKTLVDKANLEVPKNSITALVGGSGSGKTTTGLAVLRLVPFGLTIKNGEILWFDASCFPVVSKRSALNHPERAKRVEGLTPRDHGFQPMGIQFNGQDLMKIGEDEMRTIRGKSISMVFQEPLSALNPLLTIGAQIDEVLFFHTNLHAKEREERTFQLLKQVGIAEARRVIQQYPHQLSGGLRQRSMIAMAIAASPQLLIADEPTSNLDVTLQARIIDMFKKLKDDLGLSILLITHDLGMVGHLADKVYVMNEGRIVEGGETPEVLRNPQHPYTRKLTEVL